MSRAPLFGLNETPDEDRERARGDASVAVSQAEVARFAHGGEVGVGVELVLRGPQHGAFLEAE